MEEYQYYASSIPESEDSRNHDLDSRRRRYDEDVREAVTSLDDSLRIIDEALLATEEINSSIESSTNN